MDDQIPMTEDYTPEFQLDDTPQVDTQPAVMPDYVTKSDLETFAETLASKLVPQPKPAAQPEQADIMDRYAEMVYDDPKAAGRLLLEEAKRQVMAELTPGFAPLVNDYYGRTATTGLPPAEAEYIQQQISQGLNPAALNDPVSKKIILDAAKFHASQRPSVQAPQAEGSVGGGFSIRDPKVQSTKTNFERFFGVKFEDAIKEI